MANPPTAHNGGPQRSPFKWITLLKNKFWLIIELLRHPKTPLHVKALIIGSAFYLVSPVDFIPDMIPLLGITDDAALIAAVASYASRFINDDIRESAHRRQRRP